MGMAEHFFFSQITILHFHNINSNSTQKPEKKMRNKSFAHNHNNICKLHNI
jgi:hypothetical protein